METLQTHLNPDSEEFKQNAEHHRAIAQELRERLALVRQGGGEKYRKRHEEQGKLFVRERKRFALSAAGERLFGGAQRLVALNDATWGAMATPQFEGEVRLGVPPDIVTSLIPPVLQRFNQSWPRINVSLVCKASATLLEDLADRRVDLILTTEISCGAAGETLLSDRVVWVGGPGSKAHLQRPLPVSLGSKLCRFRPEVIKALNAAQIALSVDSLERGLKRRGDPIAHDLGDGRECGEFRREHHVAAEGFVLNAGRQIDGGPEVIEALTQGYGETRPRVDADFQDHGIAGRCFHVLHGGMHCEGRFDGVDRIGKGRHHRVADGFDDRAFVPANHFGKKLKMITHQAESPRVTRLLVNGGRAFEVGEQNGDVGDLDRNARR